jgi:hypothetical protein
MLRLWLHASSLRASSFLALTLLVALTAAGCGGGGGGSSSGTVTPPSAAPDFGGNVTTINSASTTVLATTTLNAFTAFRNSGSVSDIVISPIAGLRDRAFVVEDKGSVRVLALNTGAPTLDRVIDLEAGGVPSGTALGDLQLCDAQTGVVTASGNETLYVFNPSAVGPVFRLDIDAVAVTWPVGTLNSVGADVGGSPLPLTFTASAVVVGSRLIFTSSNLDASFNYNPGTVVALNWNANTRTATTAGASVIQTTRFNPAGLTLVQTPQGPVLLVTNGGPFGTGPASVDVIDPVAFRLVGQIGLGARNPGGSIAVSPDGRRGYVGSLASAEVYVLDLENIGTALASTTIADLSTRFRGGIRLPSGPSAFISSVELSWTGNYLYVVDYNQSLVWTVDLANPGIAARSVGFRRSDTTGFSNSANKLAVRPGVPGTEFQGASLFVMTGFLAPADQTVPNVAMALDPVSVNRH